VNKRAIYALMLAVLVPLTSYFIVKKSSETAIKMPRHYFPDTVITSVKGGKQFSDTIWHQLAEFSLRNQEGKTVSWKDLKGKIIIADFFFTHCPTICPRLTSNMKLLEESITNSQRVGDKTPDFLHFLSFSIDPERDSVPQIKKWADRFQVNPELWWLLTGDKKTIYDMAIHEMKIGLVDGKGIDTNFIHTDHFVLIDTNLHVRGYYHGLDTTDLRRISNDIILLSMEKDPKRKFFLEGKLELIAIVFSITILAVGILLFILRKRK
jgi:protein SCO1